MAECECKIQKIIAIEIGNNNSGYVYFSGEKNHRILTATYGNGLSEDRIPTALLLNSDLSVNSFGTLAKDRYFNLTLKKEEAGYVYFENCLQTFIETSCLQQSTSGKQNSITKEDLYKKIIEYLYDKCLKCLNEIVEDVLVIFLADDETKMNLMKSAVDKASIKKENVRFVLEMDAAALYCGDQNLYDANKLNKRYEIAVLDLGGKKSQYCKYEVLGKDKYRRICEVVLEPFGGETVTENFFEKLESIVGKENWGKFTTVNKSAYLKIRRSFEKQKLGFHSSKSDIIMEMPKAFMELVDGQTCDGISFEEDNKIIVQRKILEGLFNKSLREIVKKLNSDIKDIVMILLVGGFSQSSYARDYITRNIEAIPIVLVPTPDLAVLKGAVMMGHKQLQMSEYTYGFVEYSTDGHSESHKTTLKGEQRFKTVIHKNEMVGPYQSREINLIINDTSKEKEIVLYKTKEPIVMPFNEETKPCLEEVVSKAPTEKWEDEVIARLQVIFPKNVPRFTLEIEQNPKGIKRLWRNFGVYIVILQNYPINRLQSIFGLKKSR